MPPAIELRAASAGYPGHVVLRDIDLVIPAGERVAVMGRSGAGKTTLLNLLYQRAAERIALIPQTAALVKPLSVFHNVYMGRLDRCSTWHNLRTLAWPARRDIDEVARVLGLVDLSDKIFVKPANCRAASSSAPRWRGRCMTGGRSWSGTSRSPPSIGCRGRRC